MATTCIKLPKTSDNQTKNEPNQGDDMEPAIGNNGRLSSERIAGILEAHRKWRERIVGGERANLSGADLSWADLRGAYLRGADLSGADLSWADLRGAYLSEANLSEANLSEADLRGANLSWAYLRGANLSEANLSEANLSEANLSWAYLRGAEVPIVPNLHRQILAAIEAGGTLQMAAWHTCDTTHCRAGWAIALAGEEGRKLENAIGSNAAGAMITMKSCPWLEQVPDWYATNEVALADIRDCAAKEASQTKQE